MDRTKRRNLVITGMPDEDRQRFLDLADLMELSRDQLLILLMVKAGFISQGLDAVLSSQEAQDEWRELMVQRLFEITNF